MPNPKDYAEAVARQVRKATTDSGVTITALAERTGIPRVTLQRRLSGVAAGFTTTEIAAIATVLGTTPAAILHAAEAA